MDVEVRINAGVCIEVGGYIEDEDEGEAKSSDRGTIEVGVDVVAMIDISDGMLMPDAVKHLEQANASTTRWAMSSSIAFRVIPESVIVMFHIRHSTW
nr:hypothetical protein [Tanacetum cinerariifolium]